ncbi:unnamed protein product [Pleuronectes platessa]|uniref:Uncharacterized protein n=1 Tax=Pleuronectes platessa TaxID=8262 RepID=A0A9N7ZDF4_PLEPL|nr:unnamed protein product [Pleuronectes platessa]
MSSSNVVCGVAVPALATGDQEHCEGCFSVACRPSAVTRRAKMADCESAAPVRSGSRVTSRVSCAFYLSPSSSLWKPRFSLTRSLPAGATCLCNAEEPPGYSSPSLHLLELATSPFRR